MDDIRRFSSSSHEWLAYLMHDLRDPLERISRALRPLESLAAAQDEPDRHELTTVAQIIRLELDEAAALTSDIGSYIAPEGSDPHFQRLYLDTVLERLLSRVGFDASAKEIELDYRPSRETLCVQGDPGLLARVFQNLVSNAIQYTPRFGFVGIEAAVQDGWLRVMVVDSGPGIPQNVLPRLFEPGFRTGSGSMEKVDARGLGLAFVRRVLDMHHGRVSVQPRSHNEGSCFLVELPVCEEPSLNH
jgi:signal transduction histidine kinase